MSYIFTAFIVLFLPGLCMAVAMKLKHSLFLVSFSLSYSLFVLTLKYTQLAGLDIQEFKLVYITILLGLLIGAFWLRFREEKSGYLFWYSNLTEYARGNWPFLSGGFVILILLSAYYYYAGPYLEVPADVFQHLEYIQAMSNNIDASLSTGHSLSQYYLPVNGKHWHYFYALINSWIGHEPSDSIQAASFFNNLVFLLAVYTFSLSLFRKTLSDRSTLISIALCTTMFTFLHFGVNVFSFIRYYAMAPVMLNMALYFTVMLLVLDFYERKTWRLTYIFISIVILYSCALIHAQEALFVIIMAMMLGLYYFLRLNVPAFRKMSGGNLELAAESLYKLKINIVFALSVLVFVCVWVYSYVYLDRNSVITPKLFNLGNYSSFLDGQFILNPVHQFYAVITMWGIAVYILFFINWEKFRANPFLVCGMLSPVFTVFNPLFVDLFLRYDNSLTLWRLSFLVPLSFVAGYIFLFAILDVFKSGPAGKSKGIILILVLVVPLFLGSSTGIGNLYSRIPTLAASDRDVTPAHWGDLIKYLDSVDEKNRIITDPVTGYMISALTKHNSPRKKFHRIWGYVEFNFDDYNDHPLDRYQGFMLVINKRDGALSLNGKLARHWPEKILNVSSYYSDALEPYLVSHPERFAMLWEHDGIKVYRIRRQN